MPRIIPPHYLVLISRIHTRVTSGLPWSSSLSKDPLLADSQPTALGVSAETISAAQCLETSECTRRTFRQPHIDQVCFHTMHQFAAQRDTRPRTACGRQDSLTKLVSKNVDSSATRVGYGTIATGCLIASVDQDTDHLE